MTTSSAPWAVTTRSTASEVARSLTYRAGAVTDEPRLCAQSMHLYSEVTARELLGLRVATWGHGCVVSAEDQLVGRRSSGDSDGCCHRSGCHAGGRISDRRTGRGQGAAL